MIALIVPIVLSKQPDGNNPQPKPDIKLTINPAQANLEVGETQQFTLEAKGGNGVVPPNVDWQATGGVGKIDQSGLFTAGSTPGRGAVVATVKVNDTTITATALVKVAEGGVPPGPAKRINVAIDPPFANLPMDGEETFSVVPPPPMGSTIKWRVVPSRLGTIDDGGNFKAGQVTGKGMVIATVKTDDSEGTGKANVTVTSDATGNNGRSKIDIDVKPEYSNVKKGESTELQAMIKGLNQTIAPYNQVSWYVDPDRGTITPSTGERVTFEAKAKEGPALIKATLTIDSKTFTDWAIVEIGDEKTNPAKFKVVVEPASLTLSVDGSGYPKSAVFTANVNGTPADLPINWSWSITPNKLGSIAGSGKTITFTALEPGWGMIIAKAGNGKSLGVGQAKIYVVGKGGKPFRLSILPPVEWAETGGAPVTFNAVDENGSPVTDVIWKAVPGNLGNFVANGDELTYNPGNKAGHVLIMAKAAGKGLGTAQARLTITGQNAYGKLIAVITGNPSPSISKLETYTVSVTNSSGEVELTNAQIEWRLAPNNLGNIIPSSGIGLVETTATFTKKGKGVIMAEIKTPEGNVTARLAITVIE